MTEPEMRDVVGTWAERRAGAVADWEYKFHHCASIADLSTPEGRHAFDADLSKVLAGIEPRGLRDHYERLFRVRRNELLLKADDEMTEPKFYISSPPQDDGPEAELAQVRARWAAEVGERIAAEKARDKAERLAFALSRHARAATWAAIAANIVALACIGALMWVTP